MSTTPTVIPDYSIASHVSVLYEQQAEDIKRINNLANMANNHISKLEDKVDYMNRKLDFLEDENDKLRAQIKQLNDTDKMLTVFIIVLILAFIALSTVLVINFC